MKFSVYYKLLERDAYFEKFFRREKRKINEKCIELAEEQYKDLLELIASYILTGDRLSLSVILTRQNSKIAKKFFDHFTNSDTLHMSKAAIVQRINEFFDGVNTNENYTRICEGT